MARRSTTCSPPKVVEPETALLLSHVLALKKDRIQEFLGKHELGRSGTKAKIRERLEAALAAGTITTDSIVQLLDEVTPWGKQHVFLYRGPQSPIADWKRTDWLAELLRRHRLHDCLNASLPLTLPEEMTVSSVMHDGRRLRITAIRKRQWNERMPEHDERRTTDLGEPIELRAYVDRVTRGLVAFEWDLIANTAMLQVSQLPTGVQYEEVAEEFFGLVREWLDIGHFTIVDLRRAIRRLHELEENGARETRSHSINYRTLEGRRLEGTSASSGDPLLGEPVIDSALAAVRANGVGHLGNFYWCPNGTANGVAAGASNGHVSPLDADVHVVIHGHRNRINFTTPNDERTVRHVLSRIRIHSA